MLPTKSFTSLHTNFKGFAIDDGNFRLVNLFGNKMIGGQWLPIFYQIPVDRPTNIATYLSTPF